MFSYNIDVFIPSGLDATTAAIYEVYIKNESGTSDKILVTYDQTSNTDNFSTIATLDLPAGTNCSVILRDNVGSGSVGSFVVFDAIRFVSAGTVGTVNNNSVYPFDDQINIKKIYPNPFNPQVNVDYEIRHSDQVTITVRDIRGQHIKTVKQIFMSAGRYSLSWEGDNDYGVKMSSGLYFLSIKASNSIKTAKILLLE